MAALWAAGAQAAPITEPGVHTQFAYRYEFDVIRTELIWPYGIQNTWTGDIVEDPVLAETISAQIHPLRDLNGQTGRVVVEMTGFSDDFYDFGWGVDYNEWLQVDCLSGFICDAPLFFSRYSASTADAYSIGLTGFNLYANEIDWRAAFDGTGGGMLRFDGDDLAEGESVTLDGVTYAGASDSVALFTLANARITRLDTQPIPTPLPAPALMLISALGGVVLLRRRAGRAGRAAA